MSKGSGDLFGTREAKEERKIFRDEAELVSDRVYNAIIGGVLLWGFIINAIMCSALKDVAQRWNIVTVMIFYFVSCTVGILLVHKSNNAVFSFIGYNFIVVPIGIVLSIILTGYDSELIFRAVCITAVVTTVMLIAGTIYPQFFLKLGYILSISLLTVLVAELVMVFAFGMDTPGIDFFVVILFCGYIGYDWAAANQYQKTVDNAVDSAADLYLDIINLFLRILRILGRKK